MAKSISIASGSNLIGSPIVVSVVPNELTITPTFHRVKLFVTASFNGQRETFELSAPVTGTAALMFDISTTLRTVARNYEYSPIISGAVDYPTVSYTMMAYDEYMYEGILYSNVGQVEHNGGEALMGAATDKERFLNSSMTVNKFTRKPNTGEVCTVGETLVYADSGQKSTAIELDTSGAMPVGERNVYVDGASTNRISFQFVNGLGVVESASAECLESENSEGTTEVNTLASAPSFGLSGKHVGVGSDRKKQLKCSSGYINREWAEWWHDEFLGTDNFRRGVAQKHWVKIDGVWQPCVCILDDDTTLYDKTSNSMLHIDFTVLLTY